MNELPEVSKRVDFRYETIVQLNSILEQVNEGENQNFKLLFITDSAFIQGDITDLETDDKSLFLTGLKKAIQFRNESIIETEKEFPNLRAVNDSGFITLKNVTIRPFTSGSTHTIEQFLLFVDHIAGVTFSNSIEL